MKSLLAVVSSLLATAALAQPFVSPEVTTPVMERSPFSTRTAAAASLARDGDGFVAAWSAGASSSHIFAARLDASLTAIPPIREFAPFSGEAYDASYPDIAPIDGGYALVWIERERIAQPRAATVILARLSSGFEPQPATTVLPVIDSGVARIVGGDANGVSVLVQGYVATVNANGTHLLTQLTNWDVDDAVALGGSIGMTAVRFVPSVCGRFGCLPSSSTVMMYCGGFTMTGAIQSSIASAQDLTAIGYGGGTYVIVSLIRNPIGSLSAIRVRDKLRLESPGAPLFLDHFVPDEVPVRPSIAWDGERFLIVWRSGHDIAGATIEENGAVHSFTLVATDDDERNPIVVGVLPGRFALAYEVHVDAGHRRLAARYVDFRRIRQRPSR